MASASGDPYGILTGMLQEYEQELARLRANEMAISGAIAAIRAALDNLHLGMQVRGAENPNKSEEERDGILVGTQEDPG